MNKYFEDNRIESGLRQRSIRSGLISMSARGINVAVQIGSTLFLARILSPDDFGLVAMATALTTIASVLADLGTHDAAVQKPRITPDETSALFWLSAGMGCALTLLFTLCSPFIARFYGDSRLENLTAVCSLSFILYSLPIQHFALMRRMMEFRKLAIIDISAQVLGATTAIGLALFGAGYWALAVRPLVTGLVLVLGTWGSCRWVPGIPRFTAGVVEMLKFGLHLTGWALMDGFVRSVDRVVLGAFRGPRELGFYQNALVVYDNCVQFVALPLHSVAVASLSKLRDDPARFRNSWFSMLSALTFFTMPAFAILAVVGLDLILLLFGAKWGPSGLLLSVYALRGMPHIVERAVGSLHVAAGRADAWARFGVISTLIHLGALGAGVPFGAMGVATAYTLAMYVLVIFASVSAGRLLQTGPLAAIRVLIPQIVGVITLLFVGILLRDRMMPTLHPAVRVLALTTLCSVIYLIVVTGLFQVKHPLALAGTSIRDLLTTAAKKLSLFESRAPTFVRKP